MSPPSWLVQVLLPKETASGQPISQKWFEALLKELTEKFGGATSFIRAPRPGPVGERQRCGAQQYRGDRDHDGRA